MKIKTIPSLISDDDTGVFLVDWPLAKRGILKGAWFVAPLPKYNRWHTNLHRVFGKNLADLGIYDFQGLPPEVQQIRTLEGLYGAICAVSRLGLASVQAYVTAFGRLPASLEAMQSRYLGQFRSLSHFRTSHKAPRGSYVQVNGRDGRIYLFNVQAGQTISKHPRLSHTSHLSKKNKLILNLKNY